MKGPQGGMIIPDGGSSGTIGSPGDAELPEGGVGAEDRPTSSHVLESITRWVEANCRPVKDADISALYDCHAG